MKCLDLLEHNTYGHHGFLNNKLCEVPNLEGETDYENIT